ncbi:MAG TPA: hypothetical protein GXZ21_05865 [Clostridiales bacterium]|nr:hypothetical protein [Clostridiales bacterium]
MKIKDIVIIGMMGAILVGIQVAMGLLPIPNLELVSLLVIVFTLVFGYRTLYIIYIFVLLEGFFYGFGPWWINYLYVWTILFFVANFFRKRKELILWATISGAFGLGFGALCSIPYFITGGFPTGIAYWVSGIPFDIIHGIGNFIVTLFLFKPIYRILNKLSNNGMISV